MSGPYLFNVFLNNLEIGQGSTPALFKSADDSAIVAPPAWKGGQRYGKWVSGGVYDLGEL